MSFLLQKLTIWGLGELINMFKIVLAPEQVIIPDELNRTAYLKYI